MKHLITSLFFLCALTMNAQSTVVTGPKKQQTTTSKPKPQTTTTKPKPTTTSKPKPQTTQAKPTASFADGVLTIGRVTYKFVYVEPGTFTMGATPEQENVYESAKPAHQVTLTKGYYIGQTEVTQALWKAVMGKNPSKFKGDNLPVETVSWNDCQDFIARLSDMVGQRFRLPTEAEWEYAARGGSKSRGTKYSGAYSLDNCAWHKGNSGGKTHPVATKQANELGIYDMSGNVFEYCQDWWSKNYDNNSLVVDPKGASTGTERIMRGGCWRDDTRWSDFFLTAARCNQAPATPATYDPGITGLRLAL